MRSQAHESKARQSVPAVRQFHSDPTLGLVLSFARNVEEFDEVLLRCRGSNRMARSFPFGLGRRIGVQFGVRRQPVFNRRSAISCAEATSPPGWTTRSASFVLTACDCSDTRNA